MLHACSCALAGSYARAGAARQKCAPAFHCFRAARTAVPLASRRNKTEAVSTPVADTLTTSASGAVDVQKIISDAYKENALEAEEASPQQAKGIMTTVNVQGAIQVLLQDALENNNLDEVYEQVASFQNCISGGDQDIADFIAMSVNSTRMNADREMMLKILSEENGWEQSTAGFLEVLLTSLVDVKAVSQAIDDFKAASNQQQQIIAAEITSSKPLEQGQIDIAINCVQTLAGVQRVRMKTKVDEELESGFILQYGSGSEFQMYDNSGRRYREVLRGEISRETAAFLQTEWEIALDKVPQQTDGIRLLCLLHNTKLFSKFSSRTVIPEQMRALDVDLAAELASQGSSISAVLATTQGMDGADFIDPEKLMAVTGGSAFLKQYDPMAETFIQSLRSAPERTAVVINQKSISNTTVPAEDDVAMLDAFKAELARIQEECTTDTALEKTPALAT